MTANGSVYTGIYKEERFDGWAVLDRSQGAWHKLTGYPIGVIVGSDRENLIFSEKKSGWIVLHSIQSGSLRRESPNRDVAAAVVN